LLSLKKVIAELNNGSRHVPYKESKLTSILAEGLGGNSTTRIIVCSSLDAAHSEETLQTLRFGEECSNVENERKTGDVGLLLVKLKAMDNEIDALRETIKVKEKWETVQVRRQDEHVEVGTYEDTLRQMGGERIMTTALVGAEEENKQLGILLVERAALVGYRID